MRCFGLSASCFAIFPPCDNRRGRQFQHRGEGEVPVSELQTSGYGSRPPAVAKADRQAKDYHDRIWNP
eukprot:6856918-Pyramimonas_sp.AAC.1